MELVYRCPNRLCEHYNRPVRVLIRTYGHLAELPVLRCECGFEAGQPNTPPGDGGAGAIKAYSDRPYTPWCK